MVQSRARTTDEYLEGLAPDRRAALGRLRDLARARLRGFTESIQYGMIHFGKGPDHGVSFASQKQYVALYVGPELLARYREQLAGADLGKGCMRYADPERIPWGTVERILDDIGRAGR